MTVNNNPLVSVVITTKNEETNIRNCIEAVRLQTYDNVEIIVVDNDSVDNTIKISNEYNCKVFTKGPERSAQRNYGIKYAAKGKYALYLDADMIISKNLIESAVHLCEKSGCSALHIQEIVLGVGYFSRVRNFERSFYSGTPIDGARFFLRDAFIRVGGFDEETFSSGSGEDWDIDKLIKKVGFILMLDSQPIINDTSSSWALKDFIESRGVPCDPLYVGLYHNESDFHVLRYLRKKFYYSAGFQAYINKWGSDDPDIKCQFGFFYRYIVVFISNGGWKKLLKNPLLTIGMYYLRFLVGVVYAVKIIGLKSKYNPYIDGGR